MSLPTPAEFMALNGMNVPAKESKGDPKSGGGGGLPQKEVVVPGVSAEFKGLLIQYCATMVEAHSLDEVDWRGLARRLGTKPEFLIEAAEAIDSYIISERGEESGGLWTEVIGQRIKRAHAAKVFRDSSWESLEQLAVAKLVDMAQRNLIRDPGELLAIATAARRTNDGMTGGGGGGSHTSITINNGAGADSMDENGLPPAGAKMTIDLSPRVASSIQQRSQPVAPQGQRVIDSEMLSAADLRNEIAARQAKAVEDSSGEGEQE